MVYGLGACHNLHLQLHRVCPSSGPFLDSLFCVLISLYDFSTFFASIHIQQLTTLQEIAWNARRLKAYYFAGGILWMFCGAAILLLPRGMSVLMYAISIFIGIANALMTVWYKVFCCFLVHCSLRFPS